MDNVLVCEIVIIEFQLHYYVPFQTNTLIKGMNSFILLCFCLISTTTIFWQEWLWYKLTHDGYYAIKQKTEQNQHKSDYWLKSIEIKCDFS